MAEAILFDITTTLLGHITSLITQEVALARDAKNELEKLKSTLSTIKAVLLGGEDKQNKSHLLRDWLSNLKDFMYDADDVLEEFQYEALRNKVLKSEGTGRKVRKFFSRSNPLAFRNEMGHKIKALNERLDVISKRKSEFQFLTEGVEYPRFMHHHHRSEMTGSVVRPSIVIGRDDDREYIVNFLFHKGDGENVSILPIVGIGGLGKSTLAKLVYNDSRVQNHFQNKSWVCVSEEFDVTKLVEEIIKSLTGQNVGDYTVDQSQRYLQDSLRGKRFLLVLDDVWNEDREKWVELYNLLSEGAQGSKIIVTTRKPSVASIMSSVPAHNLNGLSHKYCLSLFLECAFNKGQEKHYPNLIRIGDEIVKKCRGVPLAVRTLGSLLYSKTDERQWIYIRDNEIWKLEQRENGILPALRLSYEQLPSHLKLCFSFCSLFPKNFVFGNVPLIQFWIVQGLIRPNEGQDLEEIGNQYIKELWSKSLFQDVDGTYFVYRFKMHDLVHDLAQLVSQNECSIVNARTQNISPMIRHVSFCELDSSFENVPAVLLDQKQLRSVLFPVSNVSATSTSFVETCVSRFKYMRSLNLSDSSVEVLPDSIGDLKLLRLLDLSFNVSIKKLPKSIYKLHYLQTLLLAGCSELEELPKDIGKYLVNLTFLVITTKQTSLEMGCLPTSLRFLYLETCTNLKSVGEGMECLTALRTLIFVNCNSLECLPHDLKSSTTLETLVLWGCNELDIMEMEEDMEDFRLRLRRFMITRLPKLKGLPKWLQRSANTLLCLRIEYCNFSTLPEWLPNFTSLQQFTIHGCYPLPGLPEEFDRLKALRELIVKDCDKLTYRCRPEGGEDWPKIAHVPQITLDGRIIESTEN